MYYNISKAQENPTGAYLRIHVQNTDHPRYNIPRCRDHENWLNKSIV